MGKEKKKKSGTIFNYSNMRIEKRLKKAFNIVSIIATVASLIGLIAIVVVMGSFKKAMENYALPQGDIALFMNEYAEILKEAFSATSRRKSHHFHCLLLIF